MLSRHWRNNWQFVAGRNHYRDQRFIANIVAHCIQTRTERVDSSELSAPAQCFIDRAGTLPIALSSPSI